MFTLLNKEITSFFSSLTGYIVVTVFLVVNGVILWEFPFPNDYGILGNGYATLEPLFIISPVIFIFLISAITMRMFAEEKKAGTLDLLITRPLTEMQIVFAKWLATMALVLLSVIPTLIFYITVIKLGSPQGNIDTGGTWGSYIGLIFLAGIYASIGIFISTITENQIVSFIASSILIIILFIGFDKIGDIGMVSGIEGIINKVGILEHYRSMSRGVLDTRDILYFLSMIAFFLIMARIILDSSKKIKKDYVVRLLAGLSIILLINIIGSFIHYRIDLTSEKKYTLSPVTKQALSDLNETVFIRVYLDGELPPGFVRMKSAIEDLLEEFRWHTPRKIQYEFLDVSEETDAAFRRNIMMELYELGLQPTNIQVKEKDGSSTQKIIFPGAVISYAGIDVGINLLKNNPVLNHEINLNNSIQALEYEFINMIRNLGNEEVEKIAFIEGQGELDSYSIGDIMKELSDFYQVDQGVIGGLYGSLDDYKAIIIAKPISRFSEEDKYVIDQYIMNGGNVLWFLDLVEVSLDSLIGGSTFAFYRPLNLEDQLFKYGVRINPDLVKDMQCHVIPVNRGLVGGQPNWQLSPWYYYPIVAPDEQHPVTKSLNMVKLEFASTIDTVGENPDIKKTILLSSSPYSGTLQAPAEVSLRITDVGPAQQEFNSSFLPLAVLLEGKFESVFRNRPIPAGVLKKPQQSIQKSSFARMLVVSDGDIIRNDLRNTSSGVEILPLGFDRYSSQIFGNKDFILNAVNYLTDQSGLIQLRGREFRLRLLDGKKTVDAALKIKLVNMILPSALIILFGLLINLYRKRLYGR
ncbi:MAG: gliding motility-associated ABC transporter substrate-binding protein GldG [Bacteroidales bacterium]|nr:gliding motility-associated ABC transporter substrate-binding protein GldG [Bacteroidales bacterium]